MDNPWKYLPLSSPYILAEDREAVAEFNSQKASKTKYEIRLEILPEPFLGKPDSPVVLLGLNPGFKDADIAYHEKEAFKNRSRGNLLHSELDYPFYLLDPGIERTQYWERKLKALIERFDQRVVANAIFCVEYFPYHSCKYKHCRQTLHSQEYNFWLVREAMERGAVILMMRSEKRWLNAIPDLASYPKRFLAKSVENPAITQRNFGEGFFAAVEAINKFAISVER